MSAQTAARHRAMLARTALRSAQHEIFAAVGPSPLFPDRDDLQPCALQFRTKQRFTRFIKAEHDNATDRKTPFHICEESFQGVIILISHGSLQPILRALSVIGGVEENEIKLVRNRRQQVTLNDMSI